MCWMILGVWMRTASIGSEVWMFGPQLMELKCVTEVGFQNSIPFPVGGSLLLLPLSFRLCFPCACESDARSQLIQYIITACWLPAPTLVLECSIYGTVSCNASAFYHKLSSPQCFTMAESGLLLWQVLPCCFGRDVKYFGTLIRKAVCTLRGA